MSLSAKLRELVRQDRPQPGRVATAAGQVEVGLEDDIQVGDAVTVQDGRAAITDGMIFAEAFFV